MSDSFETLKAWIGEAKHIVFFGGAGVSTESGIPDFRSTDGLYHQKYKYPPETVLSHSFFLSHPEDFWEFYRDRMIPEGIRPNPAHLTLARWESEGKLDAIITQNIDGLHTLAGSKKVFELHGSIHRNRCMRCGRSWSLDRIRASEGVPTCDCGGRIKPDVVLYEEALDAETMYGAIDAIAGADLLLIGGTSLNVWPAAGLVDAYRGNRTVLINRDQVGRELRANLIFRDPIGQLFSRL